MIASAAQYQHGRRSSGFSGMLRTGRSHAGIGSAVDSRGEQIITSAKTEAKERRDRLLVAAFALGVGLLCYCMQDSPPKKPPAPPS